MTELDITPTADVGNLVVGDKISSTPRTITMQRVGWYSIGMLSAGTGVVQPVQHNIHTDDEYARSQGLPAAIADGMHSTNWLSSMMTEHFGLGYLTSGSLRTKFIKPVFIDAVLHPRGVITSRVDVADGIRYELEVWIEDSDGTRLTVGDASAIVSSAELER